VRRNGSVLHQYFNRTGLAPSGSDMTDGTCTGNANGVERIRLLDTGTGTWEFKVRIKNTTISLLPDTNGAEVLGTLQFEFALGDALSGAASLEGMLGRCANLQFDCGPEPPWPAQGCRLAGRFDTPRSVKCK
jgi:hypothetical protein